MGSSNLPVTGTTKQSFQLKTSTEHKKVELVQSQAPPAA
jgi:hypothetical protein